MSSTASEAALAALRAWCAAVTGDGPPALDEPVRRAAWLVAGKEDTGGLPDVPLSAPLQSIFSRIKLHDGRDPPAVYVRRAPLALDETLFPVAGSAAAQGAVPAAELRAAIGAIDAGLPPGAAVEALLFALQRYAWCLPSPLDGVSLYDFARTHAAVAAALGDADDLFLLGGDLSGVQRFIYTLTAAGATKQLRGRSLYLQLLTEACAHALLDRAGLPATNLLYAGGGRFYLVLPAVVDGMPVEAWVADQRAMFDRFLLQRHQGELYLALGGGLLRPGDLEDADAFRTAWSATSETLNRAKRRRFAELGVPGLVELFAPQGPGGGEDAACAVCGYQGDAGELGAPDEEGARRCKLCESFEDLGRLLHNAEYLLLHRLDQPAAASGAAGRVGWQALLAELGLHIQIAGPHAHPGARGNAHAAGPVRWTTALALHDRAVPPLQRSPTTVGLRPVANTTPTMRPGDEASWDDDRDGKRRPMSGDVMPFNIMVAQSRGVKRLGVLRMDVDDLGKLLSRANTGLATVAGLSAALALFFEGRVGRICDDVNASSPRGQVYCIYSGGDDLFVVGSWHVLPTLARRIRDELAEYTGNHPEVHLSAGLSLHGSKFPLYQAAEESHDALEQAKDRDGKAAFGFLGQVIAWEYAGELYQLAEELDQLVSPPATLPRAVLQTLQQLYAQYDRGLTENRRQKQRRGQFHFDPWVWRGAYQLTRIADQIKRGHSTDEARDEARAWLVGLRQGLLDGLDRPVSSGGRRIEQLGLAARWAQLLVREERRDGTGE